MNSALHRSSKPRNSFQERQEHTRQDTHNNLEHVVVQAFATSNKALGCHEAIPNHLMDVHIRQSFSLNHGVGSNEDLSATRLRKHRVLGSIVVHGGSRRVEEDRKTRCKLQQSIKYHIKYHSNIIKSVTQLAGSHQWQLRSSTAPRHAQTLCRSSAMTRGGCCVEKP